MPIEILSDFFLATVQDRGRIGYARYGYRRCGACDAYAMQVANILCNNDANAAVIEFTAMGGRLRFTEDTLFAVTGAACSLRLEGEPVPMFQRIAAKAGARLELGNPTRGFRMYLAVRGGILVDPVLGSRSTDMDFGIGGFGGRKLRKGDLLPAGSGKARTGPVLPETLHHVPKSRCRLLQGQEIPVLRLVPGPQEEMFSEEARNLLTRSLYTIGIDSNRMGCKLVGPPLPVHSGDIISDPIVKGAVQISSGGQPIIMMADHQTTGGYGKIGTVIHWDMSVLAQLRPGDPLCFSFISIEEAERINKEVAKTLHSISRYIKRRSYCVFY